MAFDTSTRNALQRMVASARQLLTKEFTDQLQTFYGIRPDGAIAPLESLTNLENDHDRFEQARLLRSRIEHLALSEEKGGKAALVSAIDRVIREQAFTVLNRFAALRMCEERELVRECVRKGFDSRGFRMYDQVAGSSLGATRYERYVAYIGCLFDELAVDLGVLFDRFSPFDLLFPSEGVLRELLELLDAKGLDHIWSEDEAIGWVYQYFNTDDERRQMRKESSAPRNSREMAVRNQFFTPRYVVEFLTDNTLGRLWVEMTQGHTRLIDQCRHLYRHGDEVFLCSNAPGIEEALAWLFGMSNKRPTPKQLSLTVSAHRRIPDSEFAKKWCKEMLRQIGSEGADVIPTQQLLDILSVIYVHELAREGNVGETERVIAKIMDAVDARISRADVDRPVFLVQRRMKDPREIRMIDPACGSMHFGLYAYELFEKIYEESWDCHFGVLKDIRAEGISREEFLKRIPELIIRHNVHGIDIDQRAVQIAGLTLWLRAQKSWMKMGVRPQDRPRIRKSNMVCAEPMPGEGDILESFIGSLDRTNEGRALGAIVRVIWEKMKLAGEAGSLLKIEEEIRQTLEEAEREWKQMHELEFDVDGYLSPEMAPAIQRSFFFEEVRDVRKGFWTRSRELVIEKLRVFAARAQNGSAYRHQLFADDAESGFAFIDLFEQKYDVALMNPPFGESAMASKKYIDENYLDTKGDVYKAFVERFQEVLIPGGFLGIISSRTGFFLSTSQDWRERVVLSLYRPMVLADFGIGVLDAMVETAAYVLKTISQTEQCESLRGLQEEARRAEVDGVGTFSVTGYMKVRSEPLKRHQAERELERLTKAGLVAMVTDRFPRFRVHKGRTSESPTVLAPKSPFLCVRILNDVEKDEALVDVLANDRDPRRFFADTASFSDVPGSPFAYWVTPRIRSLFSRIPPFAANEDRIACVTNPAGDDTRYFRCYWEVPADLIGRSERWVSLAKGGEFRRYYADQHLVVDWDHRVDSYRGFLGTPHRPLVKPASVAHFFRAGLTYSRRSQKGFSVRILPAETIFHDKGPGIFAAPDELLPLLGVLNSSLYKLLLDLQVAFGSYEIGIIQQTPMPEDFGVHKDQLAELALRAWLEKRRQDSAHLTSHVFVAPAVLLVDNDCIASRSARWKTEVESVSRKVDQIQDEINRCVLRLYGLDDEDLSAIEVGPVEVTHSTESGESDDEWETECATTAFGKVRLTEELMDYCFGCTVGRWDVRIGVNPRSVMRSPDPFTPLPISPPGMLQGDNGLPLTVPPHGYPIEFPLHGIVADDTLASSDLADRLRKVIDVLFDSRSGVIEQEIVEIFGVRSLEGLFRNPNGFFDSHLKRYSKSRRKAPIYWPLQTSSGSFTLWIYYPRLTDQTLFTCINDFIDPKLGDVASEIEGLRTELLSGSRNAQKEFDRLVEFESELKEFRAEILRVAKLPYKPNLNDGVLITASPLWKLFRHQSWQKDLKKCWEELEAGKYDWAHLAYGIWPKRVEEVSRRDKSIAIAHGLEHLHQSTEEVAS